MRQLIEKPQIISVSVVAGNILLLTVQEGDVTGGVQIPYLPMPGEKLEPDRDIPALVYIVKDGKRIGVKVEDRRKGTQRFPFERRIGEELNTRAADDPWTFLVNGSHPIRVYRKTKPNNMADPDGGYTYLHRLYLVLDTELKPGTDIGLDLTPGVFDREQMVIPFVPEKLFSEAIHVNQVGYRKDDPSKKAYLSQWMGLGGGVCYDNLHMFYLVNEQNEKVFRGEIRLNHSGEAVAVGQAEISAFSPIYELDFSAFSQEGLFRIVVPELGCSFPFMIGETSTWLNGFKSCMNALYCQRSGIVTGKPYSEFERPRCYHPDDGQIVYHSNCSLFESGNGQNCYGTDTNNFGNLLRKATDQVVENAWGGYFDACDWDRRIQHLKASKLGMELFLMFPDFFSKTSLPIPESGNGIPDILNEALYNLAFYKRLQMPDGGIRGGIEQEEHPILGQCGWQDTWRAYAYAPDFWSSWYYASAAARMAYCLKKYDASLSEEYLVSAKKAFGWAENSYGELLPKEGHKWTREAHEAAKKQRENAAADLFCATLDSVYEDLFIRIRTEKNYDAAFIYATLPNGIGRIDIKQSCMNAILQAAENALANGERLPYHLTSEDLAHEYTGSWSRFCTIPRNTQLIRAHFLTGDSRYLAAALASSDFAAGANPDNLCFTTGVGERYPEHMLHHDSRMTGQKPPVGITVMGPQNFNYPDDAFPRLIRSDFLWPGAYVWPSFEGYLDIYRHPCVTEYTVQENIGPNAYQWGYFAARKQKQINK
jgi:endoglucanase